MNEMSGAYSTPQSEKEKPQGNSAIRQDEKEKRQGVNNTVQTEYDRLQMECGKLGISLSEKQTEQFLLFYKMLIEKNRVMNLTAITDFHDVVIKHFVDSLSIKKIFSYYNIQPFDDAVRVMDLGTGAGFPGIPLKILFPDTEFVLADSLNKRILFLREIIDALSLKRIQVIHGRAEELARKKEYREKFDFCVSRAVANLSSLSEYCLPFVKTGGIFVSYKSGSAEEEIRSAQKAVTMLGGKIKEPLLSFTLPDTDLGRILVVTDKIKATPSAYPRKPGVPGKVPL